MATQPACAPGSVGADRGDGVGSPRSLWLLACALAGEREAAVRAVRDALAEGTGASSPLAARVAQRALAELAQRCRNDEIDLESLLPRFREDGTFRDPPRPWQATALPAAALRAAVRRHLERLPSPHRDVLLLRDVLGLAPTEAACIVGLPRAAVAATLHEARLALRTLLEPLFRDAPASNAAEP